MSKSAGQSAFPVSSGRLRARPFLSLWLPPAIWAGLIFGLSSWSGPQEPPPIWFPGIDKIAHAALFGVLALLLFRALSAGHGTRLRSALLAAILTSVYGATDEWHQSFNASRSVEMLDFAADCAGGVAGSIAGLKWIKRKS